MSSRWTTAAAAAAIALLLAGCRTERSVTTATAAAQYESEVTKTATSLRRLTVLRTDSLSTTRRYSTALSMELTADSVEITTADGRTIVVHHPRARAVAARVDESATKRVAVTSVADSVASREHSEQQSSFAEESSQSEQRVESSRHGESRWWLMVVAGALIAGAAGAWALMRRG